MKLEEAKLGSRVRLPSWGQEVCVQIPEDVLCGSQFQMDTECSCSAYCPTVAELRRNDWEYIDEPKRYMPQVGEIVTIKQTLDGDTSWMGWALLVEGLSPPFVRVLVLRDDWDATIDMRQRILCPFGKECWTEREQATYAKRYPAPTGPKPQTKTEEWSVETTGEIVNVVSFTGIAFSPETMLTHFHKRFLYWRFEKDGVVDEHPFAWRAWWLPIDAHFYFCERNAISPGNRPYLESVIAKCAVMRKGE